MDVRGRRLRKQSDEITAFISSMAFDRQIASHVIRTNMAHMVSLVRAGEVQPRVGAKCLKFLARAPAEVPEGAVAEDFHQHLEQAAVDRLGVETAGYMNLGKSRNDQVATAIRMELRARVLGLVEAVCGLQEACLGVVRGHGSAVVPGYTHLQRAQPITLAHYYFAYFDSLQRDVQRLLQLYERVNVSPMGSAALGGTSVKVDRRLLAGLLGFDATSSNAMDAVASRDVVLEALSCCTTLMIDVSRLAEEQVLWSSKEFGFLQLADEYAASSSIMPQKKNPVVAEIARAKCGSVMGGLLAVAAILKSLPYSYNLDLQETTPHLWRALADTGASVAMLAGSVSTATFDESAMAAAVSGDYSTATALANHLVKEHGLSFRQSHAIVGELVRASVDSGTPFEDAVADNMLAVSSKLARGVTISRDEAAAVLDPSGYLRSLVTEGGSNPAFIPAEASRRAASLKANRGAASRLTRSLSASEGRLLRAVGSMTGQVRR